MWATSKIMWKSNEEENQKYVLFTRLTDAFFPPTFKNKSKTHFVYSPILHISRATSTYRHFDSNTLRIDIYLIILKFKPTHCLIKVFICCQFAVTAHFFATKYSHSIDIGVRILFVYPNTQCRFALSNSTRVDCRCCDKQDILTILKFISIAADRNNFQPTIDKILTFR